MPRASPRRSTRCSGGSCPRAGTPTSRASTPIPTGIATRKASNEVLNAIAPRVPWLVSGSADLTGSAASGLTFDEAGTFSPEDRSGRELHYGIREHESAAISNGLALTKLRPVWSTYLIFSDYARPAIRLSALMELPVIHWFSHDSIGLGRGRPHPSAGRAVGVVAGDARAELDPPLRRQRGRRGVAGDDGPEAPADGAGPDPPKRARARPLEVRLGRGPSARGLRARRLRRRARGDPDRDRQRGLARGRRLREATLGRRASTRRQPALLVPVRPPAGRATARACCRTRSRRGSPWSRGRRSAGIGTWARTARSSACTPSAPRLR